MIEARDVAAAYGDRVIWQGATFDVAAGEFVAVLGPNGAGKSTLLRLVLGLLEPAAGSLAVFGGPPRRGNPAIGYVPQRRPIDADLRLAASEFVRLGADGNRWGTGRPGRRATLQTRVDDVIGAVDGEAFAERAIGSLSGGELQRLMLAQALISEPRLLLLDEPLANLDVRNQVGVAHLVARLAAERGMAVVLVAHDVNPILPVVDRVTYVARGRVSIGAPDDVITSGHLSDLYQTSVEVLTDSRGRVFVVGLEDEAAHPHDTPGADAC